MTLFPKKSAYIARYMDPENHYDLNEPSYPPTPFPQLVSEDHFQFDTNYQISVLYNEHTAHPTRPTPNIHPPPPQSQPPALPPAFIHYISKHPQAHALFHDKPALLTALPPALPPTHLYKSSIAQNVLATGNFGSKRKGTEG